MDTNISDIVYVSFQILTTTNVNFEFGKIVVLGICVGFDNGVLLSKQQFFIEDIKWPLIDDSNNTVVDYGDFDEIHWRTSWQHRSVESLRLLRKRSEEITKQKIYIAKEKEFTNQWEVISNYLHNTVGLICVHDLKKKVVFINSIKNAATINLINHYLKTSSKRKMHIENLCTNTFHVDVICPQICAKELYYNTTKLKLLRIHKRIAKIIYDGDMDEYTRSLDVEPVNVAHMLFLVVTNSINKT